MMLIVSLCACDGGEYVPLGNDDESSSVDYSKPSTLVVGCAEFTGVFSPFYAENEPDLDVVRMTSVKLLTFDRKGELIHNATSVTQKEYDGKSYSYSGISDFNQTVDDIGQHVCDFKIRSDIRFGDGEKLNADDVIFTMYVLSDPSYDGPISFYNLPIKGMDDYRNGNADKIDGIVKTGDYSLRIIFDYYDSSFVTSLSITVAPLHYYGDESLFVYENNSFGFRKGKLESIKSKNSIPVGAGPYCFKSFDNGSVYFHRNSYYYNGIANIPYIRFTEMESGEMLSQLIDGNIHIADLVYDKSVDETISYINGGELSGSVFETHIYDSLVYGYIGISADNVRVGSDGGSYESKCLRKALATIFSVYREEAVKNHYGDSSEIIDYPVNKSSVVSPQIDDYGYETAFSKDINGDMVYFEEASYEEKRNAALEASKEYLIAAGFVYDELKRKFVTAPEGAKLQYEVTIHGEGIGDHPAYGLFLNAKDDLNKLGITLIINDVEESEELWGSVDEGLCDIWAGAWSTASIPNLYQIYHSSNIDGMGGTDCNEYRIADERLDSLIEMLKTDCGSISYKAIYKECFDIILDWGVEVPFYQRKDALVVSAYYVNTDLQTGDYTYSYDWINDIANFDMNMIY